MGAQRQGNEADRGSAAQRRNVALAPASFAADLWMALPHVDSRHRSVANHAIAACVSRYGAESPGRTLLLSALSSVNTATLATSAAA
jgi:hypothetical protein